MINGMETKLEFRGISREIMIKYLLSIANLTHDQVITSEDMSVIIKNHEWTVTVSKEENYQVNPAISFPKLFLTFSGEEEVVIEVIRKLRTKTLRLGG